MTQSGDEDLMVVLDVNEIWIIHHEEVDHANSLHRVKLRNWRQQVTIFLR